MQALRCKHHLNLARTEEVINTSRFLFIKTITEIRKFVQLFTFADIPSSSLSGQIAHRIEQYMSDAMSEICHRCDTNRSPHALT